MTPNQVLIDVDGTTADEKIAPLAALVRQHGLVYRQITQGCLDEDAFAPAWVLFPDPAHGLEFVVHTANNMDFKLGDQAILTIHRPMSSDEFANAKVSWHPGFTDELIDAWQKGMK